MKNAALERLEKEPFDAVFFDPAPLANARPLILGIRRSMRGYPYIALMSHDSNLGEAIKAGANGWLPKPLTVENLQHAVDDAERLTGLVKRLGDESEDFPSAGGVIAKSAFNQLFLSAVDRADRYGERSYLVFIGIRNDKALRDQGGAYAADYAAAKLSQYLVRLRRQSDIIAQTGRAEYCLLLQRPVYETEPLEAANRFAAALEKLEDICAGDDDMVEIGVSLLDVPVGNLHCRACHYLPQGGAQAGLAISPFTIDPV